MIAAMLAGAPAYAVLARFGHVSPSLLDRPWLLASLVVFFTALPLERARRAGTGTRRLALVVVAGALSLTALFFVSREGLPAPSREIALGTALPDASFEDELGRSVSLPALRGHPTVLVFYRGALCVACRAQLSAFGTRARAFLGAGVHVFGVSADPPSVSAEWRSTLGLPFSLLSDERQTLAESLCSARAHCLLLVDPEGVIRWGALNDYWRGAEPPESVLLAAYRLGRTGSER
ncbi:MAG TPA: peroxiredoxin family protein [Polyangiaceae bacterium]|nr:peroxiredoxin family protein [Polyangiaceae bacterium]